MGRRSKLAIRGTLPTEGFLSWAVGALPRWRAGGCHRWGLCQIQAVLKTAAAKFSTDDTLTQSRET